MVVQNGVNSMRIQSAMTRDTANFINCRFNPCNSTCSIPDGSGGKHVCMQLYGSTTISTSGTTLYLQFNPWLPTPVLLYTPGTVNYPTIDGSAQTSAASTTTNYSFYYPLCTPSSLKNISPGNVNADVYSASTVRFCGFRFRVTNITASMFRSGTYQAFPNSITVSGADNVVNVASAPSGVLVGSSTYNGVGGGQYYAPVGTGLVSADGNIMQSLPSSEVYTQTTDKPIDIYLKKTSKDYKNIVWPQNAMAVTTAKSFAGSNAVNMLMDGTNNSSGFSVGDNDFDGVGLIVSGLSTTQSNSIMVEAYITMEVRPQTLSSIMPFTKDSPKQNEGILNKVIDMQNKIPIARPGK
jgi:hypothetical protein